MAKSGPVAACANPKSALVEPDGENDVEAQLAQVARHSEPREKMGGPEQGQEHRPMSRTPALAGKLTKETGMAMQQPLELKEEVEVLPGRMVCREQGNHLRGRFPEKSQNGGQTGASWCAQIAPGERRRSAGDLGQERTPHGIGSHLNRRIHEKKLGSVRELKARGGKESVEANKKCTYEEVAHGRDRMLESCKEAYDDQRWLGEGHRLVEIPKYHRTLLVRDKNCPPYRDSRGESPLSPPRTSIAGWERYPLHSVYRNRALSPDGRQEGADHRICRLGSDQSLGVEEELEILNADEAEVVGEPAGREPEGLLQLDEELQNGAERGDYLDGGDYIDPCHVVHMDESPDNRGGKESEPELGESGIGNDSAAREQKGKDVEKAPGRPEDHGEEGAKPQPSDGMRAPEYAHCELKGSLLCPAMQPVGLECLGQKHPLRALMTEGDKQEEQTQRGQLTVQGHGFVERPEGAKKVQEREPMGDEDARCDRKSPCLALQPVAAVDPLMSMSRTSSRSARLLGDWECAPGSSRSKSAGCPERSVTPLDDPALHGCNGIAWKPKLVVVGGAEEERDQLPRCPRHENNLDHLRPHTARQEWCLPKPRDEDAEGHEKDAARVEQVEERERRDIQIPDSSIDACSGETNETRIHRTHPTPHYKCDGYARNVRSECRTQTSRWCDEQGGSPSNDEQLADIAQGDAIHHHKLNTIHDLSSSKVVDREAAPHLPQARCGDEDLLLARESHQRHEPLKPVLPDRGLKNESLHAQQTTGKDGKGLQCRPAEPQAVVDRGPMRDLGWEFGTLATTQRGLGQVHQQWWRHENEKGAVGCPTPLLEVLAATLGGAGEIWLLRIEVAAVQVNALVDSGATRSFVVPSLVMELGLEAEQLEEEVHFKVATGAELQVVEAVMGLEFRVGNKRSWADFLVASVPYQMILGAEWLQREGVVWDFGQQQLVIHGREGRCVLPVIASTAAGYAPAPRKEIEEIRKEDKLKADEARRLMVEDIQRLDAEAAGALVRPAPKRYKGFRNRGKLVPIKVLLKELRQKQEIERDGEIEQVCALRLVPAESLTCMTPAWDERAPEELQAKCGPEIINKEGKSDNGAELGGLTYVSEAGTPTYAKFEQWIREEGRGCSAPIIRLLCKYKHLFGDSLPPGLPPERVINHTITLVPGKLPSKGRIYKLTKEELEAQRDILKQLKESGWITHTSSPFAAPAMIVSKKDDATGKQQRRMVINYQELNAITISPEYPLPTIQDILDMLHGAQVFTIMDMEQGFHQIRMDPHDQYKTAFRTCMGQYEFKVMPFGLRGAPGTFQAVMNHMFFPYIGKGVIAYLDDLLVYSKDIESHAVLLEKVLQILERHKMYPKISKCSFAATSIEYLGYRVGKEGITPSPEKVDAIKVWPEVLQNVTQVRQFIGAINYCRMFMGPAFSDIARPLFDLLRKDIPFRWTEQHTAAVKALKERLIHYTTLQVPDPSKPYVLRTDASGYALGAVLEQNGKPLGFMSQKMKPAEVRYSTYDQELLALVTALLKWRTLLMVAKVTAYTDHRALQYLTQAKAEKPVRGRVARWLDFLADFQDLTIVYQPGANNVVADALSRCPVHESEHIVPASSTAQAALPSTAPKLTAPAEACLAVRAETLAEENRQEGDEALHTEERMEDEPQVQIEDADESARPDRYRRTRTPLTSHSAMRDWKIRVGGQHWLDALQKCADFGKAYSKAKAVGNEVVTVELEGHLRDFKLAGNLLLIRLQGLWRICVPSDRICRQYVMYQSHDHPTAGHMGIRKTYDALARRFYWPGIRIYARTYVESCPRCRSAKHLSGRPAGLLQCISIPNRRWADVSLDFITGLPRTQQGHDAILTIVDRLSKMAHFVPTTANVTAEDTVRLLADRLVRYHGLPAKLISDRDPKFTADVWKLFCQRFSIKRALSSSWHPQTDGQTERVHRTLEQMLRTYIQYDEAAWEDLLPAAELAYNCTTHNSTGLTPFEVMNGENPLTASDLDVIDELEPTISPPMTKLFQQLVDRAAAQLLLAQTRYKHYADQKRRDVKFKIGDMVWVSTRNMQPSGVAKFQPRFIGPFRVLEPVGAVAYRLELPDSMQQHPVFHVSLLQKHVERPSDMLQPEGWAPVASAALGDMDTFEVEHILDMRGVPPHEEYLVKWKGYSPEEATWEPRHHLTNCKELLRAFRATRTRKSARLRGTSA